jgi:sulfate transport system permease protein
MPPDRRPANQDPWPVRWGLTLAAVAVLVVLVVVPVAHVFAHAFSGGVGAYLRGLFGDPLTRHAILLTLIVAPAAVALNVVFGVAAAWAIARFRFPGRALLLTLIDLPFSVSPVVAGLVFVLLFGMQGYCGPWLKAHGFRIIFATPGLVLVTAFVTFPFVARELIPVLEAVGPDEEIAARSLGAGGWQMFWRVTLPNVKWGVLYGVILCNARAMGEFGAVYVVSGHVAGRTDTMPLQVEKLFQEYNLPGAFAVASVLTLLALVTLVLKVILERNTPENADESKETVSVGGAPAAPGLAHPAGEGSGRGGCHAFAARGDCELPGAAAGRESMPVPDRMLSHPRGAWDSVSGSDLLYPLVWPSARLLMPQRGEEP